MSILATDNFNRANTTAPDIGANWTQNTGYSGSFSIQSAIVKGPGSDDTQYVNNTFTSPNDGYVEVTLVTPAASGIGTGYGVVFRAAPSPTQTCYRLVGNASGYELGRFVDGAYEPLADVALAFADGDRIRLGFIGTRWTTYKNGTVADTGTDTAITSGSGAGIAFSSSDSSSGGIDNFEAGDFQAQDPTPNASIVTIQQAIIIGFAQ